MKSNFDDDYFIKWKVIFKPRWTSCRDSWAAQRTRRRRWIRFPSNQHCSCASSEINCIENPVDLNIKHLCFQLLRMAIHQKLVLTQRLEDIEMTDLRPANVTNNQQCQKHDHFYHLHYLRRQPLCHYHHHHRHHQHHHNHHHHQQPQSGARRGGRKTSGYSSRGSSRGYSNFQVAFIIVIAIIVIIINSIPIIIISGNPSDTKWNICRGASGDMAISQDVIFEANRPTRELSIKEVDRDFREPKNWICIHIQMYTCPMRSDSWKLSNFENMTHKHFRV